MNKFDSILFDLDGTLTDSFDGITGGVLFALDRLGMNKPERADLKFFIGPPLSESFAKLFGGDATLAERAVALYREYYAEQGWKENRVYDGVPQMLETLSAAGKTLIVATAKPEKFSRRIIEYFGLDKFFKFIAGATFDKSRAQKEQVIEYALTTCGVKKSRAVMVGDRFHDITGAKLNGISSIGVLYGYGSLDELKNAGADFIAQSPAEVAETIIDNSEFGIRNAEFKD